MSKLLKIFRLRKCSNPECAKEEDKDEIAAMLADGRVEAFKTAATSALEEMDADEVTL